MNLLNIVKPTDMLTAADWQITPDGNDVFVLSRPGISYKINYITLINDVIGKIDPSSVGLTNVDNTADLDKPISDAVRDALLYKADLVAGKIPVTQLPMMLDDVVEYDNLVVFPRPGEAGKIYVAKDTELVYRWAATVYVELSSRLAVGELAGQAFDGASGRAVRLHSEDVTTNPHGVTQAQVGLSDVDNTADLDKPVSDDTQTALDLKVDIIENNIFRARTDNPHQVDKGQVGLSDVDNTTDLAKPISTATQTALDSKTPLATTSAHIAKTDNPHSVTATQVGLGNVDDTSDMDKPVSTATANAISASTGGASTHQLDMDNPHGVDKVDIGLGDVDNTTDLAKPISTLTQAALDDDAQDLTDHENDTANPHGVTQAQVGLANVDNTADLDKPISTLTQTKFTSVDAATQAHLDDVSNPHEVTKAQVGLGDVDNTSDADKPVSDATQAKFDAAALAGSTHLADLNNPHQVTKAQVGLTDVDDTSDMAKPVSTAQQSALDTKQSKSDLTTSIRDSGLAEDSKYPSEKAVALALDEIIPMITVANVNALPLIGEEGVIYVADDTGDMYRWTGSAYGEMSGGGLKVRGASVNVGEGLYTIDASGGATFVLPEATGSLERRLLAIHSHDGTDVIVISGTGATSKVNGENSILVSEDCVIELVDASMGKWVVDAPTGTEVDDFMARTDNPHGVDAGQVGLGNVDNTSDLDKPISTLTQDELDDLESTANTHIGRSDNPHSVTASQLGLGSVDDTTDANKPLSTAAINANDDLQDDIDNHISNTNNPHEMTKAQLGLGSVDNVSDANKPVSTATQNAINAKQDTNDLVTTLRASVAAEDTKYVTEKAIATAIESHTDDTNNPHGVTKAQVGLGDANNTSDADKPVSDLTATAIGNVSIALTNHGNDTNNPHQVTKSQVGLGNCDNTADMDKPISIAAQLKFTEGATAGITHVSDMNNPHQVTAAQVGLGDADDTSDADKPISTAVASALLLRDTATNNHLADQANPHNVDASDVGLGNCDNTTDADKPVSTAQLAALNLKQSLSDRTSSIDMGGTASNTKYPTERAVYLAIDGQPDMIFVGTYLNFPTIGLVGSIYIAEDTNYAFRWDASISEYVELSDGGTRYRGALNLASADDEDGLYRASGVSSSTFSLPTATGNGRLVKIAMFEFNGGTTLTIDPTNSDTINASADSVVLDTNGVVEFIDILAGKWVTGNNIGSTISEHHLDTTNPHEVDKQDVGLGLVDNTADVNKPVSGPQITALNAKQSKSDLTLNVPSVASSSDNAYPSQKAVASALDLRQSLSERTSMIRTPATADNNHYPTEKAVSTALDAKLDASSMSTHTGDYTNPHSVSKAQVGLANVDNTADSQKPISIAVGLALDVKADLVGGKVPANQLPAYVDDVFEYANYAAMQLDAGETGKLYVTLDDNKTYRWGGSTYVEISSSLAIGNVAGTAFDAALGHANTVALTNRELLSNKTTFVRDRANATHVKYPTEKAVADLLAESWHVNPFGDFTDFPVVGNEGEIYLDKSTNLLWSWNDLAQLYKEASYNGLKYKGEITADGAGSYSFDCLSVNSFVMPEATGSGDRYQLNVYNYSGAGLTVSTTPMAAKINGDATDLIVNEDMVITLVDVGVENWVTRLPSVVSTHETTTGNPHSVTKAQVGLSDVNNTSDLAKPVSTATQNALDLKVSQSVYDTFIARTDNPHSVTASQLSLGNVDNTTDLLKPISNATQNALDDKQNSSALVTTVRPSASAEDTKYPSEKAVANAMATAGSSVTFVQSSASTVWVITHNLGYFPCITVTDSSGQEIGGVRVHTDNELTITFSSALTGKVTYR